MFVDSRKLQARKLLNNGAGIHPCFDASGTRRVNVSMTMQNKHMMPVGKGCSFWHPPAFTNNKAACTPRDGHQLEDQASGVNFHLNSKRFMLAMLYTIGRVHD